MNKKQYIVVKVVEGVTYYYMRHPGTVSWHRGHFLGYWTKKKSKATVFFEEAPEDWPKHRFYQTARDFILSVLSYTERTFSPEEWFKDAAKWTASHAMSLHYGRSWFRLKINRWLYELPVSGTRLTSSGKFFYMDIDTGEKHFEHKISSDLSQFQPYIQHPAKAAKREHKQSLAKMTDKKNYDFNISFTMPATPKSDPQFELDLKKYELMSKFTAFLECFCNAIQEAKSIEELENVKDSIRTELLKVTNTNKS